MKGAKQKIRVCDGVLQDEAHGVDRLADVGGHGDQVVKQEEKF